MKQGIIVLGHGTHVAFDDANQVIFQLADILKSLIGHTLVEPAIMNRQSCLQGLAEAIKTLADKGAEEIIIAPVFLIAGAHITTTIPEDIDKLRSFYPGVSIKMAEHIGADKRIAEILLDRIKAVR